MSAMAADLRAEADEMGRMRMMFSMMRQYPATCIKDIKQICMLCGHTHSSWRMPQREREPVVPSALRGLRITRNEKTKDREGSNADL